MLFINYNGEIISGKEPVIDIGNRGYWYGDGVFESVRIMNGTPINLDNHIKRLLEGAKALKMQIPAYFHLDFFKEKIHELIQLANLSEGGKCRISIDRASGGTYKPTSNDPIYLIELQEYVLNNFELNAKGLEIDQYTDIKKVRHTLSNFKTKSGLIYVMAAIHAKEKNLDDVLLVNDKGSILESSNSNLFVVSNGVLYTPGLEDGCLAGTMRMQVINLAVNNGIKVYECNILPQNLLVADEVFLTNAIQGITWVSGYRTKRYFNNVARKFVAYLNDYWENQFSSEEEL
jgi:branched-subunit amino acid aminotransferase/4-amino-4-deoxychorismate lyase